MRPRFEWAASLREQIASAFGDESGVEFKPMLPFLGMRSLLQESGKLQQTDILLRRLLSVATSSRPTTTVLLFCHCPHAAHLLQRLLVYRRFTHAAIAEATPPAQRSRKLQAVRQTRVHVLLFQGASFGPALGIRAAFAAIFFDQDPSRSVTLQTCQQAMGSEAANLRVFYLVSCMGSGRGWEEKAVSLLAEPTASVTHATSQLLQAERSNASSTHVS